MGHGLDALDGQEMVEIALPELDVRIGDLLPRQEGLGLEIDQDGGHQQEFGLAVDGDERTVLQIDQIFPGDDGDGDVVDLDLLFLDEKEEQIQRPLEDGQLDLVALARKVDADVAGAF